MCVENQGALCAACRSSLSLLLGWESQPPPATIGFQEPNLAYATEKKLVNYDGGKHICSIARTGAGKGRGCIIPNLLHFQGQTIVFDPKGENYHVTARYRRELGQRVVRIDPFHVIDDDSDAFNPFDLFALSGSDVETDAQTLAAMLAVGHGFSKDPFWDTSATRLITGVIAHLAGTPGIPESDRTLAKVCDILQADDTIYALAVLLDTVGEQMPKTARREIAAFLQQAERETRPSILATALTYLKVFTSGRVAETLRTSTFDLNDVVAGKPLTIYLILPVERLDSHRALMRMWVGVLLSAVFRRRGPTATPTLFLLDEVAQLDTFPLLERAVTVGRGFGLQVWMFFQDVAQLQKKYPEIWQTLVNNSDVLQTFGIPNQLAARQCAEILAATAHELISLKENEQLVRLAGRSEFKCQRIDYLTDPMFAGRFDKNPLIEPGLHNRA